MSRAEREALLSARVSNIIASHPDALELLIAGGFPLLAQAPLRWAMAHTVNLGQAFRIAGVADAKQEALLQALMRIDVPASLGDVNNDSAASYEQGPLLESSLDNASGAVAEPPRRH